MHIKSPLDMAKRPLFGAFRFCAAMLLVTQFAWCQEISRPATVPGPYYVGEPVPIQISVSNLTNGQNAKCAYAGEANSELTVSEPNVGESTSTMMSNINGRITQSQSTTLRFTFQATALKPGTFDIGPFEVDIDGTKTTVRGTRFEFKELEDDPNMRLAITLGDDKIYVGEQVPVQIRWEYSGELEELQYIFSRLQVRSQLFEQFEFLDEPLREDARIAIATSRGVMEIDATAKQEMRDGESIVAVTGKATLLANAIGDYQQLSATCRSTRVTAWTRDFFGRQPRSTVPIRATAEPLSFSIVALPKVGQPASFSGAVGNGFSIDVTADRSVVQVGDPIKLDVVLRGDGNLENLTLPNLVGPTGFSSELFQVPSELPSGVFDGGVKMFEVAVRVKDPAVDQIPAIAFSWFDPSSESYQTALSKPIALQVRDAQRISAADVVSANRPPDTAENTQPSPSASATEAATKAMSFVGANLAIEKNVAKLMVASSGVLQSKQAPAVLYSLGLLSLVAGFAIRRRAVDDSGAAEQKQRLRAVRKRIQAAKSLPTRKAAEEIAASLREFLVLASTPPTARAKAEPVIARCETLVYQPNDTNPSDAIAQLAQEANEIVGQS